MVRCSASICALVAAPVFAREDYHDVRAVGVEAAAVAEPVKAQRRPPVRNPVRRIRKPRSQLLPRPRGSVVLEELTHLPTWFRLRRRPTSTVSTGTHR